METTATGSPLRAGGREWLGLAVLALPTLLTSLDTSVLFLALPHISADLDPSGTQQLWIVDIYALMIAGFLVTMGTLGDRIGRRLLLLIGASLFAVASVLAAYSSSAEMLIATRALLGIAGATLMPSTLGLIRNMFQDPAQRAVAIAAWMSTFMLGIAIGPLAGGALLDSFWWGSVFLLGVPVMLVLLLTGPLLLPEFRSDEAGRVDLGSVLLSLLTMMPIFYGIKELAADGPGFLPLGALVVGAVFGVLFVMRQNRLTSPLLDLSFFRNSTFSSALTVMLIGSAVMGGITLSISQFLQLVEGMSPMRAGLWLLPAAVSVIVSGMASVGLAQKLGAGNVICGGLLFTVIGGVMLSQVDDSSGVGYVITCFSLVYFGIGPMSALTTDIVVGSAPAEKAGSAASTSETSTQLGVALGVACLGSVGSVVYSNEVEGAVPSDVLGDAAATANDSLAGAVTVAPQLPGDAGAALLESARSAFVSGMGAVGVTIGVLVAAMVVLSAVKLRKGPSGGGDQPAGPAADDGEAPDAMAKAKPVPSSESI
ncbi:MFS transporter [Streptomyces sp. NPDC088747]|uniref:MFS transporter n=1 Tax=Streptomyces sp. NPDC088747 TaxID=3365886 RepID=UPI00382459A6